MFGRFTADSRIYTASREFAKVRESSHKVLGKYAKVLGKIRTSSRQSSRKFAQSSRKFSTSSRHIRRFAKVRKSSRPIHKFARVRRSSPKFAYRESSPRESNIRDTRKRVIRDKGSQKFATSWGNSQQIVKFAWKFARILACFT